MHTLLANVSQIRSLQLGGHQYSSPRRAPTLLVRSLSGWPGGGRADGVAARRGFTALSTTAATGCK